MGATGVITYYLPTSYKNKYSIAVNLTWNSAKVDTINASRYPRLIKLGTFTYSGLSACYGYWITVGY